MTARSSPRKPRVWYSKTTLRLKHSVCWLPWNEIEALLKDTWEPNIRFDLQVNPAVPVVTCSRVGLQSAIMNLLFNARDAMPKGGVISLVGALIYEGQVATDVELRIQTTGSA
jgi:signal transduction histidine kinase